MRITGENYREHTPEQLAEGLHTGTFELVETGVGALVEIVGYIAQAVGQRKRLKLRIEALENFAHAQVQLNKNFETFINQQV